MRVSDVRFYDDNLPFHNPSDCLTMLKYLAGTVDLGITFSDPGQKRRHILTAWVDSDYAVG